MSRKRQKSWTQDFPCVDQYTIQVSSLWSLLINRQGWRQLIDSLDFNKIESLHGTPKRVSLHVCALAPWLQQYCYKFSFSFLNCEQRESIRMGGRQMEKVCLACLSTFHHCPFASLLLALLLVVSIALVYFVLNTLRFLCSITLN